jgi:hypothetical protein
VTATAGIALLAWSWWQSSGTGKLDRQTTWTAVGVLAVSLIAFGNFLWVSSGRRAVRLRRDQLAAAIEQAEFVALPGSSGASTTVSSYVAVAGSNRYHRDTCLLVRGKQAQRLRTGRTMNGLRPCEMCES